MNNFCEPNQCAKRSASRSRRGLEPRPTGVLGNGLAGVVIEMNWVGREIRHRGGRRCQLSVRETALLACLARKAGIPVSRDEILSQAWGFDPRRIITRTIDMHISCLRRKLEDNADRPMVLLTVHGVGYMLCRGAIVSDAEPPSLGEVEAGARGGVPIVNKAFATQR